jgi:oligopeptide transport system permease protein
MAVAQGAKPLSLNADDEQFTARTPWLDAWTQFRRNKMAVLSLIFIIGLIILAVTADFWQQRGLLDDPYFQHEGTNMAFADPMTCSLDVRRQDPQWCFILGTDEVRRDFFTRILYGTRVSMAVGVVGASVSMLVGVTYGVIAGYYGGRLDNLMMRFVDFMYAIPDLALIILLQTFFKALSDYRDTVGPFGRTLVDIDKGMGGLFFLFIVIGLLSWIGIARLSRGQILGQKNKEYVEAARAIGARNNRIIFTHLLPNILGPLVVVGCLSVPAFIFTESALSFLGIGVNPPVPSWGSLIADAQRRGFASTPHMVLGPGLMLTLTVLAFNFLADGLRDALDPSLRGT